MTSSGVSAKGKFIILLLKEKVLITGGVACFPLFFLLEQSCIITERKGLYGTLYWNKVILFAERKRIIFSISETINSRQHNPSGS